MEVVEVDDFQCHSDGEEVVLLDLDKANDADDSLEVHEVTVDDANEAISKQGSSNGVEIIETCDVSLVDELDTTGDSVQVPVVESIECTTHNAFVINNDIPPDTVNDLSDSLTIDEGTLKQEVLNAEEVEVEEYVESESQISQTSEIDCSADNTVQLNNTNEVQTDESVDVNNKITVAENLKKDSDNLVVLTKDKVAVTIPQHIAGRDISSLTEETLPRSGKRMLKPRFGVKVPYIHMTSQIVSQDEIAKEIFERFKQKYPVTNTDKPDKLFSMKLTHRLANKMSPLKTPDDKSKDTLINPENRVKKSINAKKGLSIKKPAKLDVSVSSSTSKFVENNPSQIQSSDSHLSNNVSKETIQMNNSQHIDQITNTLQSLGQSADQHMNNGSDDKSDEKISSNEELIAILEDFENIETADTNGNKVPETPKPVVKRKIVRSTTRTKRSKPKLDPEIEKQIALKQLQEVSRPKRFDTHYAKRKAENDKKLLAKNDLGSAQKRKKPTPDDVPEVKIAIDHYIKSYTDKRQSTVKVEPNSDETVNDSTNEVESEIKTNNVTKARTMREINRLLGDEGAINMIYSLEKRRSPGNNNSKNVLPSTRRKKKDLMLKTKLVKNAMLKMSSPTTSSISNIRLGRRSDVSTPSTAVSSENKCTRKISVDSQGSDQSIKSLGNFSGRKIIPADESKIIRKHSSSSEASSIGGSPHLPVPDAIPLNELTTKHTPVKALRVYTRKNKNSDDSLNFNDVSFNEVSKETNKNFAKTKNSTSQKVKKQPAQTSKLSSK